MAEKPNVTRIKAQDDAASASTKAKKSSTKLEKVSKTRKKAEKIITQKPVREPKEGGNVLRRAGGYFKGAWVELRQVRWPNRRATWSLTLAVIAFTLGFTVLILALDALFKYVFQLIIG